MALTLTEFIKKYNGDYKVCTPSGSACGQCVGLFRRWVANICGTTSLAKQGIPSVTYAEEIFGAADSKKWIKIKNSATNYPRSGDIVIWNGPGSKPGHVAIARSGCTKNLLKTFDQNWSRKNRCTLEEHDYDNVIGWLRRR